MAAAPHASAGGRGEDEGQALVGPEAASPPSGVAEGGSWFVPAVAVGSTVVLGALVLLAIVSKGQMMPPGSQGVITAPSDDRAFAVVTLSNGLQTLLISDPQSDKAAAAADVGVGSWRDPPTVEGLAHFCEHMLFLGTVKYPEEDEYNRYLSSHGGASNAYTDSEHTNYYFTVDWKHLPGALDRFAQFFIAPLLAAESADKEVNAIESEHHKNLQEDVWRLQQLTRSLSLPGTPVSRFSTGNLATLDKPDIVDHLHLLHSKYYVASNMRAALLGREPLVRLHELAERTFGVIPANPSQVEQRRHEAEVEAERAKHTGYRHHSNAMSTAIGRRGLEHASLLQVRADPPPAGAPAAAGGSSPPAAGATTKGQAPPAAPDAARAAAAEAEAAEERQKEFAKAGLPAAGVQPVIGDDWKKSDLSPERLFPKDTLGRMVRWRPVGDSDSVLMLWPLPEQLSHYRAAPVDHISSLLGDESEGSVLLYLKNELRVAESLSAGSHMDANGFSMFEVSVTLNPSVAEDGKEALDRAVEQVAGAVFAYLELLRAPSAPADATPEEVGNSTSILDTKWRWEERRAVAEADFRFPTREDASDMVSDLARSMFWRQSADLLNPPSRWLWEPALISKTLAQLVPERAIILVSSRSFLAADLPLTEPIYGTKYSSTPLDQGTLDKWGNATRIRSLHLPSRNPYVPKDLAVLPLGPGLRPFQPYEPYTPEPTTVSDEDLDGTIDLINARFREEDAPATESLQEREKRAGFPQNQKPLSPRAMAVWWRQDETFRKPLVNIMMEVETISAHLTAKQAVLSTLYLAAADDFLQAEAYRAQRAGYVYALSKSDIVSGFSVVAGGFREHMYQWLTTVVGALRRPALSAERLEAHKGLLDQQLDNAVTVAKPYTRVLYFFKSFTGENRFSIPELRNASREVTMSDLEGHAETLWSALRVVMLVHGDVNLDMSGKLARVVSRAFAGSAVLSEEDARAGHIQVGWVRGNRMIQRHVSNAAEGDSAVGVFHQLGLREDCFAGLQVNGSSPSLLQRVARRLRQEPMQAGEGSEALGQEATAVHRNLSPQLGEDAAMDEAELVRRRECVVRSMASSLLGDALYQPAFEELRTKQQLGYLVFAGLTTASTLGATEVVHERDPLLARHARQRRTGSVIAHTHLHRAREAVHAAPREVRGDGMLSLYVIVQGPDHSPALLDVRVTQFLATVNATLEALAAPPEEDGGRAASAWEGMVQAQIIAKKRKPLTLADGSGLMWGEIAGRTFRFARRQEQLEVLEGGHIEMVDLLTVYNSRVLDLGGGAGRLSVQVFGADMTFETPLDAWKRDFQADPAMAGTMPAASNAVNVTSADPVSARLV
jgi:secreted Zn-dependent insulinase-like peptidase